MFDTTSVYYEIERLEQRLIDSKSVEHRKYLKDKLVKLNDIYRSIKPPVQAMSKRNI